MSRTPSQNERRRSDKDGRFWVQCHFCKRWFRWRNREVRVCGVLLDPPEAHCMLCDDFGKRWWPKNKEMPDLIAIQERQRQNESAEPVLADSRLM